MRDRNFLPGGQLECLEGRCDGQELPIGLVYEGKINERVTTNCKAYEAEEETEMHAKAQTPTMDAKEIGRAHV